MITSFALENFRCFDRLSLSDLKRVTVITGASGTGKTALLEALLIAAKGHPDAVIRANKGRALPEAMSLAQANGPYTGIALLLQGLSGTVPSVFNSLWTGLFHNRDFPVGFQFTDSTGKTRSLKISFNTPVQGGLVQMVGVPLPESSAAMRPVLFERLTDNAHPDQIAATLLNGQVQISKPLDEFGPVIFYFESAAHYNELDNITWFSDLKIRGRAANVTDLLVKDFSFIKGIEVLSPGGVQAIYAVMADDSVRSLSLVSSGIHKMFSLYCGSSDVENGIVLLDEIENGIYYERYGSLWENLYEICSKTQNQLFVTVHSLECLKALLPVLETNQDDFCLLRTERKGDRCSVRHITGKAMRSALQGETDLRGTSVYA